MKNFKQKNLGLLSASLIVSLLSGCGGGGAAAPTGDTTAPTVTISPDDSATGIFTDTAITATFNEDIFATTIDGASFTVTDGADVDGTVTFDELTNVATFRPSKFLALLRNYTVNLGTGITDLAGNALADTSVSFTTQDGTWKTEAQLENAINDSKNASAAHDADGNALIVWVKNDGEFDNIVSSSYSGGSFSTPVAIETEDLGNAIEPKVAMDSNGNAFAIWHQFESTGSGSRNNVWVNRFDASTRSWATAEKIESSTASTYNTNIAMDINGNAFAIWNQRDTAQYNIWVNRYDAATGNWGAPEKIETEDFGLAVGVEIAFDGDGNAIAVWQQSNVVNSIWSNRYNASNDSWGTAELIETDDTSYAQTVKLAVAKNGNAIAVWNQNFGSGTERAVANRYDVTSGTWGSAEIIDTNPTRHSYNPEVAIDAVGNATVVWNDENDAGTNFYIRSNTYTVGSGWGTVVNVEDTTINSVDYPRIVMDENGNAISVWSSLDAAGDYYSLYSSRFVVGAGWSTPALLESGALSVAIDEVSLGLGPKGQAIVAYPQEVGASVSIKVNLFE